MPLSAFFVAITMLIMENIKMQKTETKQKHFRDIIHSNVMFGGSGMFKILMHEREKIAPEILRLTDELMK